MLVEYTLKSIDSYINGIIQNYHYSRNISLQKHITFTAGISQLRLIC